MGGIEQATCDNLAALVEIRDNAAHFLNKDLYLARRILEIGTAAVKNFAALAARWFNIDFTRFDFFLMPISFYHGFETVEPAPTLQSERVQKLLAFLDALQQGTASGDDAQSFAMRIETKLYRGKDPAAVQIRYSNHPDAPAVVVKEEDILKNFPYVFRDLCEEMRKRYNDFLVNADFHTRRRELEKNPKLVHVRTPYPRSKKGGNQQFFYSPNVFQEFDRIYTRRRQ